ncbi:MAG: DsbA family protein [Gammaproteobacteria bacterium]|nr:DsbA family protein [Gammaproteobacteria bacterium]
MANLPEIKVTVYSDYICPFCYVGHHRLMRLKDSYDLKINWCFLEIHPENSAKGEPVTDLDYSSEFWNELMRNLKRVAEEENIPLAEHTFTTNSKDASLLAEASKQLGRETFYQLHEKLFTAFFVDKRNIGDRDILRGIAKECGINNQTIDAAWTEEKYRQRLLENFNHAKKHKIKSVPSFVFGKRVLTGVVDEAVMRDAAAELIKTKTD